MKELEEKIPDLYTNYIYLFSIDEERFYLIPNLDPALLPGYAFYDVRILRGAEPKYLAFAAITGYQLFFWYKNRRFCGCCGKPMGHSQKERYERTYDVLPFLRTSGISGSDAGCDRRHHQR